MADNELRELDYDPLEYLDQEGIATLANYESGGGQAVGMSPAEVAEVEAALVSHEVLSGCFAIYGPISLCYSLVGTTFRVCLKLAGFEVTCQNVSVGQCVTLQGNVLLAKASVKFCIEGRCLTYQAQACYRPTPFSSWRCASRSGRIICI